MQGEVLYVHLPANGGADLLVNFGQYPLAYSAAAQGEESSNDNNDDQACKDARDPTQDSFP